MPAAQLRLLTIAWLSLTGIAQAQQDGAVLASSVDSAGAIYDASRQDVTLPVATAERLPSDQTTGVTIPVEDLATPMRCMTAWSYLAGRVIQDPDTLRDLHPDFTEANASAHWQHWLRLDVEAHQGALSADFHQRRLAAERAFSLSLAAHEEAYAYRTLGICYVPMIERQIADPTLLLRNFMVNHQGLPDEYKVPVLQRQLRAFPISKSAEAEPETNCDSDSEMLQTDARTKALIECFEKGGILASQVKTNIEDLDGLCRATATVQCENIP